MYHPRNIVNLQNGYCKVEIIQEDLTWEDACKKEKEFIALYGRSDIPIVFTGLRPGEKLTEDLLCSFEKVAPTNFEKVQKVSAPPLAFDIARAVKELEAVIYELDDAAIGQRMHKLVQAARKALRNVDELDQAVNKYLI